MNRTIALAYGITGLAVAAALVAIIGSTTGLLGSGSPTTAQSQVLTASTQGTAPTARAVPSEVEVIQVDAPPTAGRPDDDDDDDDDEHEHSERHGEHDGRGHDGREDDDD